MRRLTRRAAGGGATLAVGETGRARSTPGTVVVVVLRGNWDGDTGRLGLEALRERVGTGGRGRRAEWTQRRTRTLGERGRQILGAEGLAIPGLLLVDVLSGSGPRGKGNLG